MKIKNKRKENEIGLTKRKRHTKQINKSKNRLNQNTLIVHSKLKSLRTQVYLVDHA